MVSTMPSLTALAALLRDAENVISPYVCESDADPALGQLVAAGPRAAQAPEEYTFLVEAIREGYLLHYGTPRLIDGADEDLRLLAGDYLYALGLERLAARGDLEAVRELADLISLSSKIHAEAPAEDAEETSGTAALWLASLVAVAAGSSAAHARAKEAVRDGDPNAPRLLYDEGRETAESAGLSVALATAAESIGFAREDLRNGG